LPADRLSPLHLLPPTAPGVWAYNPLNAVAQSVRRVDGATVPIELPLFWYNPPWVNLEIEIAAALAVAVAEMDVVVSALRSDLAVDRETPRLFLPIETDPGATPRHLPRMMPYRIERYGVAAEDFDDARLIEVHLSPSRDATGRYAYSPMQMQRWERPGDDTPIGGGGFIAGGTFPTDIVSLKQARIKLEQLRRLSPPAAVFVSIGPYRLEEEIAAALVAMPDGIIVGWTNRNSKAFSWRRWFGGPANRCVRRGTRTRRCGSYPAKSARPTWPS